MPTSRFANIVVASSRVYSLLLRLCPAGYRGEYGTPMAQAFRDRAREAYARRRAWGVMALWLRVLPDTCATALAEHRAALRQADAAQLRVVPTILVLLSLLAPWYRFSDGSGTFPGWLMLVTGLLPGDWSLYHVLLVVMAASLAMVALVAFRVGRSATRLSRWQPALLSAALACPVAYIRPRRPAVLWGPWLTVACIGAGLALEGALWVGARRRLLVAYTDAGPGAPPPAAGGAGEGEPEAARRQGPGRRRRRALLVPLGALALLAGAGLLASALVGWPFAAGTGADGAYAEACRALTAAQEMPLRAWRETLLWRAIGEFGESLRVDPANASALCNRGVAYAGLGWYDEAVADYTSALAILPGSADVTKNRGLAYERWGKPRQALADYEAFLGMIGQAPGERRAWERATFAGKAAALRAELGEPERQGG